MSKRFVLANLLVAGLLAGLTLPLAPVMGQDKRNLAATPSPRLAKAGGGGPDAGWVKRHEGFVEIAKKNENPILFTGDSITDGWRNQAAWKKYFDPMKAANFGIGGDRTEHVLWRLQNGELDGYTPKVVVLMIGTNNTGSNTADEIAEGIKAIIKTIHDKSKDTKVLLLAVFPRGEKPGTPVRDKIAAINKTISALDDGGKMVLYMDIGSKFTEPDGTLTKAIMPDFLHLSPRGYEIWGEAIVDTVQKLAGGDGKK
jgi:lysophospholipase L1-like esterase